MAPKPSAACVREPSDRGEAPRLWVGEEEESAITVNKGQCWVAGKCFPWVLLREESREPMGGVLFIIEIKEETAYPTTPAKPDQRLRASADLSRCRIAEAVKLKK